MAKRTQPTRKDHSAQETEAPAITRKSAVIGAVALAAIVLTIYGLTLVHTVSGGDSGELIGVLVSGGVAHPPGYPLYTMLGRVFSEIPVGSVGTRVSLLSAVAGTGAAVFLFLTVLELTGLFSAAALSAGLFAFSPLVWTYAVSAEVFALNNFFCAGLIYLYSRAYRKFDRRWMLVYAVWCGLGLSHHHTMVLFVLPLSAGLYIHHRSRIRNDNLEVRLILLFVAGLLPYLYLPLASMQNPLRAWGDQTTVTGFLRHLLRSEYGTFQLASDSSSDNNGFLPHLGLFIKTLPSVSMFVGLLLIPAGWRRRSPGRLYLFAAGVFYLIVMCGLSNMSASNAFAEAVQARFWQQPHLLVCFWIGLGLSAVVPFFGRFRVSICALIAVGLTGAQIISHFQDRQKDQEPRLESYAHLILEQLPSNSVLLVRGDHTSGTLSYQLDALRTRRDVRMINTALLYFDWAPRWFRKHFPDLELPPPGVYRPGGYQFQDLLDRNREKALFFSIMGAHPGDEGWKKIYRGWVYGLSELILERTKEPDFTTWSQVNESAFPRYEALLQSQTFGPETWEAQIQQEYFKARHNYAAQLLDYGTTHPGVAENALRMSIRSLEAIEPIYGSQQSVLYRNLGAAYFQLRRFDPAAEARAITAWKHYLSVGPRDDSQMAPIADYLRQMEKLAEASGTVPSR